ncbi:MAG TPA: hypothetical protein ENH45_01680 [Nitrospirae bacterium]|nr:hypothetical protein [Nitrospirota bacterium]HDZ83903.1 hypothetical protein [Nitrospirota bacterium]
MSSAIIIFPSSKKSQKLSGQPPKVSWQRNFLSVLVYTNKCHASGKDQILPTSPASAANYFYRLKTYYYDEVS